MRRIALIEDDASLREVVAARLRRAGFDVDTYAGVAEALAGVAARRPDAIVTDLGLADGDGLELLERLRADGVNAPAIVVSAQCGRVGLERARELGVSATFDKPVRPLDALVAAIQAACPDEGRDADILEAAARLDALRLELLTDLSHRLRTPLTALRMGLDGLFAQLDAAMDPSQRRLAHIARRNVDRVVTLVSTELELLQMLVGDVPVCRGLVDVRDVIRARIPENVIARDVEIDAPDAPVLAFTDAARLGALVAAMLCGGPPGARRRVTVRASDRSVSVVLGIDGLAASAAPTPGPSRPTAGGAMLQVVPPLSRVDFEARACAALVEPLGGRAVVGRDENRRVVQLEIPVLPPYERHADFLVPVRGACREADACGGCAALVRLEHDGAFDASSPDDATMRVLGQAHAVLGDGERILRGLHDGVFYVLLVDRDREQVSRIVATLRAWAERARLVVHPPETLREDPAEVERIVDALDPIGPVI